MDTRVCLIYFVHDCPWKQSFASNLHESPSNLIFGQFANLVAMRLFRQFQSKIRATKLRKTTLPIFSQVQIRYRKTFKFGPERF